MNIAPRSCDKDLGLVPGIQALRGMRRRKATSSWDGVASSAKALNASAQFESLLESDFLSLLDADPRVHSFACQPHRKVIRTDVHCGGASQRREYTPDFVVKFRDGRVFVVEIKAAYFAEQARWRDLEPIIAKAYREDDGVNFIVFTEREIRLEPRLSNAKTMLRHRFSPKDDGTEFAIRDLLAGSGGMSIGELASALSEHDNVAVNQAFGAVMRLGLKGAVRLDGRTTFDLSTRVELEVTS